MEGWTYILEGEVGCKKNSNKFNTRTRRMFKTAHFRNWHDSALFQVLSQRVPPVPVARFQAGFVLYHGTRRRVDSDNQVTSLLDLLQDARVIADDCWTCCPHKTVDDVYRKGKPGAEVTIYPLTDDAE